jgi:hypothetical protein
LLKQCHQLVLLVGNDTVERISVISKNFASEFSIYQQCVRIVQCTTTNYSNGPLASITKHGAKNFKSNSNVVVVDNNKKDR